MPSAPPIPAADWLPDDSETDSFSLPDGRRLAYATYGDADGYPVLFCHGTPGSHVIARLLATPARERGVRLIAPDRPGIGNSEDASVTLDDWPDDAGHLLSHLDVDAAGTVGFSGGGAFALACHRLSEIERVALIGSSGPPSIGATGRVQRFVGALSRHAPWALNRLFRLQRWFALRQDPSYAVGFVAEETPETDALAADEVARIVRADMLTSMARGPSGISREQRLLSQPWPVALEDVSVPVTVFQGQNDANVAPSTGEGLAQRLPDASLERVDSDHLGTLTAAGEDALAAVQRRTRV
ncbi:alpha/beta hydrolase [Haloarcula sp. CBA1130]|uniref:alpha/beta fold hydrolase n=1 Tax=unclassified Haloarcula TaxID=2624677 RepID=UPI001244E5A5|nr:MULTISPECIES: alpha/beta hydrolase [unclassified Haloarcula]KAA9399299.1 alpha/beta hydrolase [Haloarcula sp. CBA1129]KAA9403812.1 alpha/beta hydrolase [Haloarcula sp. CBA1130]